MKKIVLSLLAAILMLPAMAQDVPTTFPRKHLIEHFTGEDCGYCPYGMNCIAAYMAEHTNCIWLSHHYGYATDQYTIAASSSVGKLMGVSGAPQINLNRAPSTYYKTAPQTETAVIFHPGYLEDLAGLPSDETTASIAIENTFADNQLTIHISGQVGDPSIQELSLNVAIKESGMIGKQSDYYYTWEGWREFRHTNTIRALLTPTVGATIQVEEQAYDTTITFAWNSAWMADSSMVVAYISEVGSVIGNVKEIINAEEAPVVAGTDGGASIEHGGITLVPIADTYPEYGAPLADITMSNASLQAGDESGQILYLVMQSTQRIRVSGYQCTPYLELVIATSTPRQLANGTYSVAPTIEQWGYDMIAPGFRDEENFSLEGSQLYYVYNNNGSLYPMAQWLVVDGEVTIEDGGKYIHGQFSTLNGSTFAFHYGTPTDVEGVMSTNAPAKLLQDGQLLIRKADHLYNVQGILVK